VSLPRARSTDQPDEWPVTDTFSLLCAICALSNVAMGLSGKMRKRHRNFARDEEARKSLPFAKRAKVLAIYLRQLLAPLFRLVTAKTQKGNNLRRPEKELVRLRPSTTRKNQPTCFYICRH
jgi:hypothetical protein